MLGPIIFDIFSFQISIISNHLSKLFKSIFSNKLFQSDLTRLEFLLFNVVLFDHIWFYRNSITHDASSHSVQELVNNISNKANMHWLTMVQSIQTRSSNNYKWSPPPAGWSKINVDSTFSMDSAFAGAIITNELGTVLRAASNHHTCLDATSAECLAILDACKIISELKMDKKSFLNLFA
ncbi:hypothetical protein CASFOL_030801 [Castilleja foliolosa]|uniref:RNase H type-1 domain-containing protein n=1 Tax=Castilleja foliolosa TaxID=1961234 RepID=A0ABD3C6Z9_9LAMI